MNASIKSEDEIAIMRKGGQILANIVKDLADAVRAGISTKSLDKIALDLCKKNNVKAAFWQYNGYPAVGCFGVNDVVVHGIPSEGEILKSGDIISIDMGVIYKGFYVDHAVTIGVGEVSKEAEKLIEVGKQCLASAIKQSVAGNSIGDIGCAIQTIAEGAGFSVVKQMVGHGVGRALHEDPQIPCYGLPGQGLELRKGMTLAIEVIINQGQDEILFLDDGWTTKTVDGKLSALFEHTVAVGEKRSEILTKE